MLLLVHNPEGQLCDPVDDCGQLFAVLMGGELGAAGTDGCTIEGPLVWKLCMHGVDLPLETTLEGEDERGTRRV